MWNLSTNNFPGVPGSYPENHLFKTRATAWGCEHEWNARDAYIDDAEKTHIGLVFWLSGLVLPGAHKTSFIWAPGITYRISTCASPEA